MQKGYLNGVLTNLSAKGLTQWSFDQSECKRVNSMDCDNSECKKGYLNEALTNLTAKGLVQRSYHQFECKKLSQWSFDQSECKWLVESF